MAFKDLAEVLDDTLRIPLNGKEYVIHGVTAESGLWFQAIVEAGKAQADAQRKAKETGTDAPEEIELPADVERVLEAGRNRDLQREALGDALDELISDGVSQVRINHLAQTVVLWTVAGRDQAEEYFNSGGKAVPPNRAARRTATRTRTGAASTKTGSRTTTSTPKGTAKGARGKTS
ncbi:hypothetical protein NNX28_17015 [Arthrobacter sp. zg-Y859]|uniref:DUF7426 domain-containing protein n=1 Tax=Arthrobacter jinronghuae TaxID=2964609 RepID=A0ABT1NV63_9MICC|nr:hypothetical protein [Arthrobacter jinronghuae]MCQ1951621.1 hypothetical protein [Arthrobacter jinronghuae]UWX79665.1 hypothetical protein N2K98_05565 [Arthrobacter jinronghuae]